MIASATNQRMRAPLSRIAFRRLVFVELRKSIDTRASQWMLATTLAVAAAFLLIGVAKPSSAQQSLPTYVSLAGIGLDFLLPIVAILALTSEWSQRSIVQTFTQEPRRVRVLRAKVLSGLVLAVPMMAVAIALSAAALAVSAALGRHVDWIISGALLLGFVLSVLLNMLLGMAFGILLQNTAAAIVMLFVPTIGWGLLASLTGLRSLRDWLDPTQAFGWVSNAQWTGHEGQILTPTAFWEMLTLVLGAVRTVRREVK